jgi:hypothetical protein
MIQAREYFLAANAVSIATKPNLLYYGTMSLALAEILFKQTGDSSIDRARSEHRHHGLSMTAGSVPRSAGLRTSSSALRASPLEIDGRRKGTFELWHKTSREAPLAGERKYMYKEGTSTTGFEIIYGAIDKPYPPIPSSGITLEECLAALPFMTEHVNSAGVSSCFVRGSCESQLWPEAQWKSRSTILLHPSQSNSALIEKIHVDPNAVDRIQLIEISTGLQITTEHDWMNGYVGLPLPPAATINTEEWRMWTNDPPLNEFGYFYVALFLAGNYARYYPDRWLKDVESSGPLALAIEELCTVSEWRAPWLALSELDMTLYVNEA